MTSEWISVLDLYRDKNTIDKLGKSEIQREFLKRFPEKNNDHFDKLVRKRIRLPTPLEEEWLTKTIRLYWNRYHSHKKGQTKSVAPIANDGQLIIPEVA